MSTSGSVGQPAKIKQTDCFAECPLSVLSVSCWFSPSRCLFPPVVVTHNYSISTRFAVSIHDRQRPRTDDSLIRVFCFWTAIHNRPLGKYTAKQSGRLRLSIWQWVNNDNEKKPYRKYPLQRSAEKSGLQKYQ